MKAYDFEYDGKKLSDFGYMICFFDSGGLNTVSGGSQITFNTVSTKHGELNELISSEYSEIYEEISKLRIQTYLSFEFDKNDCIFQTNSL